MVFHPMLNLLLTASGVYKLQAMIYDCFIFNSELDLLSLRLAFLNTTVDYFVIVESERTLSGNRKPLYFDANRKLFKEYEHKLIHIVAPDMPELSAWEYEYFQRNFIKQGLLNCNDNDIIVISDLDEIVNIKTILTIPDLELPALIDLPYYYYFFNLKGFNSFPVKPLMAHYVFLKDMPVGERSDTYSIYIKKTLRNEQYKTGWHFSYLFGFDIKSYQTKIQSFSHQEYNTEEYLNESRIQKVIKAGIDLFERDNAFFTFKDPNDDIKELMPHLKELKLEHFIYRPSLIAYYKEGILGFVITKKYIPFLMYLIFTYPKKQLIIKTRPFRTKLKQLKAQLFSNG